MRIHLLVRPLGKGAFEGKPLHGNVANELRAQALEDGAPPSCSTVIQWESLADLQTELGDSISDLKVLALQREGAVEAFMDENLFKQRAGLLRRG